MDFSDYFLGALAAICGIAAALLTFALALALTATFWPWSLLLLFTFIGVPLLYAWWRTR